MRKALDFVKLTIKLKMKVWLYSVLAAMLAISEAKIPLYEGCDVNIQLNSINNAAKIRIKFDHRTYFTDNLCQVRVLVDNNFRIGVLLLDNLEKPVKCYNSKSNATFTIDYNVYSMRFCPGTDAGAEDLGIDASSKLYIRSNQDHSGYVYTVIVFRFAHSCTPSAFPLMGTCPGHSRCIDKSLFYEPPGLFCGPATVSPSPVPEKKSHFGVGVLTTAVIVIIVIIMCLVCVKYRGAKQFPRRTYFDSTDGVPMDDNNGISILNVNRVERVNTRVNRHRTETSLTGSVTRETSGSFTRETSGSVTRETSIRNAGMQHVYETQTSNHNHDTSWTARPQTESTDLSADPPEYSATAFHDDMTTARENSLAETSVSTPPPSYEDVMSNVTRYKTSYLENN